MMGLRLLDQSLGDAGGLDPHLAVEEGGHHGHTYS